MTTVDIPFVRHLDFEYGRVDQVSPLIRRVIAPNPGLFTFTGTGTYIVGQGHVAVIDPGPTDDRHLAAIGAALDRDIVSHIFITHTHNDHSPAAAPLKKATGAKTYGYGRHGADKPEHGMVVEQGGDRDFVPDVELRHGDVIKGKGWTIECVHTPGHTSNHMCYGLIEEHALFTGDHIMGWSTSVIAPPDGDMRDYMASLDLLLARNDKILWPTHGPPVLEPNPLINAFIDHRRARENQIIACLRDGLHMIEDMVPHIYVDMDKQLYPAAALSVYAHLLHLVDAERVRCEEQPTLQSRYRNND